MARFWSSGNEVSTTCGSGWVLECADPSALWSAAATGRSEKGADWSAHSEGDHAPSC